MSLNIYVLDTRPDEAVRMLADRHLLAAYDSALGVLETATALRRWVAWREVQGTARGGPSLAQVAHPRHPITRHAARSDNYAAWVYAYGLAAATELFYRELRATSPAALVNAGNALIELHDALNTEDPADPVTGRRLCYDFEGHDGLDGPNPGLDAFPQRLDGAQDLAVAADPVAAYRAWYAQTKIPGAVRAWEGAQISWTRRAPAWLGAGCEVSEVPWCGLGTKPAHAVYTAHYVAHTEA